MVCGARLEYFATERKLTCSSCGKVEKGSVRCPEGHYVCDECHNHQSIILVQKICSETTSTDPLHIFEKMIAAPDIPMLGCHHAFMAAGAFITAVKNQGNVTVSKDMMHEVYARTKRQAIGGYCGLTGVCGIAPALGACFAVILGSKCGTDSLQKITMSAVSEIVLAITDLTGPSCCRAYARKSLEIARNFASDCLQINLSRMSSHIACSDVERHPHGCRKKLCPYYKPGSRESRVQI